MKGGELLSDSFAAQGVFPKIYTTTLMAGEKSGNMEEVLGRYIAFQRLALTFKKKLAVSLVYPALLVTVVLVMLIFLVTYVVPQFAKLFENLNAQLPAITVFMLAVGTHAQKYGSVRWASRLWLRESCSGAGRTRTAAPSALMRRFCGCRCWAISG